VSQEGAHLLEVVMTLEDFHRDTVVKRKGRTLEEDRWRRLLEPGAPQQARSSLRWRRTPRLDDGVGEANIPERGLE
jgi:hypothetical protein